MSTEKSKIDSLVHQLVPCESFPEPSETKVRLVQLLQGWEGWKKIMPTVLNDLIIDYFCADPAFTCLGTKNP